MNAYLAMLTPPTAVRTALFGAASRVVLTPDRKRQSVRLFNAAQQGGGLLVNERAASGASAAGFDVVPIALTTEERTYVRDWLGQPEVASAPRAWLFTCTGQVVRESQPDGSVKLVCRVPGTQEVDTADAVEDGIVDMGELPMVGRFKRHVRSIRTYLPAPGFRPSDDQVRKAFNAVRHYDDMANMLQRLTNAVKDGTIQMTPELAATMSSAVTILIEQAQPVAEIKEAHPDLFGGVRADGQYGIVLATSTVIAIVAAALTVIALAGAAIVASISCVAVVAIGAAAYAYLSSQGSRNYQAYTEMRAECARQAEPYLACVKDPNVSLLQRQQCLAAVKQLGCTELPEGPEQPDPAASLAEAAKAGATAMKAIVPLAALGAVVYFFGPAIKEAAGGLADKIEDWRAQG